MLGSHRRKQEHAEKGGNKRRLKDSKRRQEGSGSGRDCFKIGKIILE